MVHHYPTPMLVLTTMRYITTIHSVDKEQLPNLIKTARVRIAARAVVLDGTFIALLHVARDGYHKLPGGGLEGSESIVHTLKREILEETGCEISNIQELGQVNEYRDKWDFYQESFCYIATANGAIVQPSFTEKELAAGFEVVWAESIDDAIALLQSDKPTAYEGDFIQRRDLVILKEAKKLLK